MLRAAIGSKDINGSILQSLFVLIGVGGVLLRINTLLYKDNLVELTNQLLHCNTVWGKFQYGDSHVLKTWLIGDNQFKNLISSTGTTTYT